VSILVLDASALLAFFKRNEKGHERVMEIIKDPSNQKEVHAFNVVEVYWITSRSLGAAKAEEYLSTTRSLGIKIVEDMDEEFWKDVAWLKATYHPSVSMADGVVLALARRRKSELLGSDSEAFLGLAKAGIIRLKRFR
jgi:PIN domain nuclease of toxin-antitoxin system